jgi:hypothetical protein
VQKFVDQYSKGPDIGFRAVNAVYECFGGHVEWGPDFEIRELVSE